MDRQAQGSEHKRRQHTEKQFNLEEKTIYINTVA